MRGTWSARLAAVSLSLLPRPAAADEARITCRGEGPVCAELVAGERDLTAVLVNGDTAVVERHFADDAVWSLGNGRRWTKAEAVAAIAKAPRMTSSRLIEVEVRQFGTIAIVLWREGWHERPGTPEAQSVGTDTWLLRDGRWRVVASQEARMPPPSIE